MDWYEVPKEIIGATVASVEVLGDGQVALVLSDGRRVAIGLDGDCCSHSYFTPEALEEFKTLAGSTIRAAEECDGESREGLDAHYAKTEPDRDAASWHFLKFTTDKGHVTIDWRNDSNGYYDGSVSWLVSNPTP